MNCIEKGTKLKLRLPIQGLCTIEDLFDINLSQLDLFAINLTDELDVKHKSFVSKKKSKQPTKQLMLDIVVRVIEIRVEEARRNEKYQDNKALRTKAARILADRKDSAMEELSDKELEKLVRG